MSRAWCLLGGPTRGAITPGGCHHTDDSEEALASPVLSERGRRLFGPRSAACFGRRSAKAGRTLRKQTSANVVGRRSVSPNVLSLHQFSTDHVPHVSPEWHNRDHRCRFVFEDGVRGALLRR